MDIFFILILVIVILIVIRYIIKYFNGDYTIVSSEILREGERHDEFNNTIGWYYDVKITYQSGRIKIKSFNT